MRTPELPDSLRTIADALQHIGFEPVNSQESKYFGDALVVLKRGFLRVRITRDRGQILVDFASSANPERWFNSYYVCRHLQLIPANMEINRELPYLGGVAHLIEANADKLESLFDPKAYRETELILGKVAGEYVEKWLKGRQ